MLCELPGQQIVLYNETDIIIKDLYFYIPGTDIEYKCKKLKPGIYNQEHIYDGYAGDLIFFFKSNPKEKYIFHHLVNGKNRANSEAYFLIFRVLKKDGKFLIERRESSKDFDRIILQ